MKKVIIMFALFSLLQAKDVYHIKKGEKIEGDISIIGKSAIIEGKVEGEVVIINGDLELYGEVDGDVAVIGGDANLYSGSRIEGDFAVVGGKMYKEEGAEIEGEITEASLGPFKALLKFIPPLTSMPGKVEIKDEREAEEEGRVVVKIDKKGFKPAKTIFILVWGISLSLLILIIGLVIPTPVENMNMFIEKKAGYSFLAGFLAEILFVPCIILLAISILGIPIIPFFVIAFILALLLSLAPSSLFTGKILKKNLAFLPDKPYLLSFLGLVFVFIVWVLGSLLSMGNSILGVFGFVVSLIAIFILYLYFTFGLGSIILSRLGTRKP